MATKTDFSEFVGVSPAGVEWVAYKPESVEPLKQRLLELWAKHGQKTVRVSKLTPSQCEFAANTPAALNSPRHSFQFGQTWFEGRRYFLALVAEDLVYEAEHGEHEEAIEGIYHRTEPNPGFVAAQVRQRVRCFVEAARKIKAAI